jgi:predicted negative regulator of RcsB-dependent stress response
MSEATQTQPSIEQTLNKTDLGHMIYENRKIFFGVIISVLVLATGYLIWNQTQKSAALEDSVKVFEFQSGPWADAKAGKTDAAALVSSFEALDEGTRAAPIMLPVVLEMSKFLYEKGNYAEAETMLSKYSGTKDQLSSFFVNMQRAIVLEKLGKIDEAVKMIEPLAQAKDAFMAAKVSVNLGRLYLAQGEKGKAQTQFDHVINTYPNDEQAKVAKLYLSQMTK